MKISAARQLSCGGWLHTKNMFTFVSEEPLVVWFPIYRWVLLISMCSLNLCNVISKTSIHMYRRDGICWYLSADTSKISWSRVSVVCCSHSYCFYNTFSWVYLWQECVTLMVNCTTKHQHKAVQGSVDRNTVTPEDHPSRAQFLTTPKSKESSCCQPSSFVF